jgi:hypothetical protein
MSTPAHAAPAPEQARLPYAPRPLIENELSREDVYIARSPKLNRVVMLIDVLRLSFWLELEFDATTETVVERPRHLQLHTNRTIELDFWTRGTNGTEQFWAVIGADDFTSTKDGLQPKDTALWDQSAHRAGLSLKFVYEHELDRRAQRIANYMRLLPHVQAARRLAELSSVAGRVKELFSAAVQSLSFTQIEGSLGEFAAPAVRMATCTLVHSGWLSFPQDLPLSGNTRLTREAT